MAFVFLFSISFEFHTEIGGFAHIFQNVHGSVHVAAGCTNSKSWGASVSSKASVQGNPIQTNPALNNKNENIQGVPSQL